MQRHRERGNVSGALPLLAIMISAGAAFFISALSLPDAVRQAPSIAGVAAHMPLWAKLAVAALLYFAPVVVHAFGGGGFAGSPRREKAVIAAGCCFPLLTATLGFLFGGSLTWGTGAGLAGIPAGFVVYGVLGALFGVRPKYGAEGDRTAGSRKANRERRKAKERLKRSDG